MISIAIVPAGNGLVWGWRSARSKRQKWLWLLIAGSAITCALAWVYYLKPDIRLAVIIVGLMVVGLCVLRAWMWLADKASKKIETRAAERMGLTPRTI
jgi:dolichyl-phosphate-mannose--protein O-mannosyl transferase